MKRSFYFYRVLTVTLFLGLCSAQVHAKNPYPNVGTCNGLPQVNLKTPEKTCVGVVASDLKTPRGVLPLSDNELWVTEMGSWERNRGRLSRLVWDGKAFVRSTILDKLDRPHGIALGVDGWIYVGEADKIIRLKNAANAATTVETVVDNLPSTGHHPLKQIALNGNDIYIAVGAETDHCERSDSALNEVKFPCAESNRSLPTAAIWRVNVANGKTDQIEVVAKGLRNSMGMAFAKNGQLVQTENSRDNIARSDKKLNDAQLPHDEINVIRQGADYGWPYCFDNNRLIPEYQLYRKACIGKSKPTLFLPAHSAPLGLTQYPNNGNIAALRGMWLIALHGYRDGGHRVVGFAADSNGLPTGALKNVIGGWRATDNQPMGAPTEIRVAPSGAIYITDDRNDSILRLSAQ